MSNYLLVYLTRALQTCVTLCVSISNPARCKPLCQVVYLTPRAANLCVLCVIYLSRALQTFVSHYVLVYLSREMQTFVSNYLLVYLTPRAANLCVTLCVSISKPRAANYLCQPRALQAFVSHLLVYLTPLSSDHTFTPTQFRSVRDNIHDLLSIDDFRVCL